MTRKTTIQSSNYLTEIVISKVCDIISQQDMISVLQTCKTWYLILTPNFYRRIIINGSQCYDNFSLTKLQFDGNHDIKFDSWLNFKIPETNLKKLYSSLVKNNDLIQYIEEIEVFDCYKTELRFHMLQILELVVSKNQGNFKNFKCHHTTSNQFYYQCLCYQDYWIKLVKYLIAKPYKIKNLCLNFNDFIRFFIQDIDLVNKIECFEIIINSYELMKIPLPCVDTNRFCSRVQKLTINNNFEIFAKFVGDNKFSHLRELNINISYLDEEILKFFDNDLKRLTKLSLNFEDEDEWPLKLLDKISKLSLLKLSIRLNNDKIYKYLIDNFPNLILLSILNSYNEQNIDKIDTIIKSKPNLKYFNYQFEITTINDELFKIYINEVLPMITPKHDYRYLDQDLNLHNYPSGKITKDIIDKINQHSNYMININKCMEFEEIIKTQFRQLPNLDQMFIGGIKLG